MGVEPYDPGVAHRCVTATLRLLGGVCRHREFEIHVGASPTARLRSPTVRSRVHGSPAWVGWESNPRHDGLRNRCKASICYQPIGPPLVRRGRTLAARRTRSLLRCGPPFDRLQLGSHPLESNQNLSVFSRARTPSTQEWGHHRSSVVRDRRGAQGAPRATMRSHGLRAHQSRTRDLDSRSRIRKTFKLFEPKRRKGHLVSRVALQRSTLGIASAVWEPTGGTDPRLIQARRRHRHETTRHFWTSFGRRPGEVRMIDVGLHGWSLVGSRDP